MPEVTSINKQRFLAELGKLLTFMYEEDRLRALELYTRMFDEAEDERALIQSLVSPTKQAVVVARAYNSNLGRLSVHTEFKAQAEDRDENGVPDYVQAIDRVRAEAYAAQPRPAAPVAAEPEEEREVVDENQMTLFGEGEEPAEETEEPAEEAEAPAEDAETPAEETEEPAEEAEAPAEETEEPAEEAEESAEEAEAPAEETEAPAESKTVEQPLAWHEAAETEAPAAESGIEYFTLPREGEQDVPADENGGTDLTDTPFNIETGAFRKPKRKPKVFALIVYILFAIPLTLAAIAVLLVPAVLFLGLSVAAIICGAVVVSTAFNGFAVFADIMVLLGGALVLFALGLLFLWTSIWFVGGAIVALVHGVAALCDKWCYKEVQD